MDNKAIALKSLRSAFGIFFAGSGSAAGGCIQ